MKNYQEFLEVKQLIKKRSFEEAINKLKKLHELEPNDRLIKFELAKLLINRKIDFKLGKKYLEELLNTPNANYAMLELGRLELKDGNIKKARTYFEKLLNTSSSNYAMLELGRLEVSEGNVTEARTYFEKLLNTSNANYAMLELGRLEVNEGNVTKARTYFEKLLNTPSSNYAMLELGRLEVNEGNVTKARTYFEKLLNTPSSNYAMLELGRLEVSEGNVTEARTYFEKLLNTSNANYAMLELGRLEVNEGNVTEARTYFEKLISDNSQNKNYAMLELLYIELKEENYNEVYNVFEKVCSFLSVRTQKEILNYIKAKTGKLDDYQILEKYFFKQLFYYNEKEAINHIKLHLDENEEKKVHSVYYESVDIEQLFYIIKEKIKGVSPIRSTTVDKYIIKCENEIGKSYDIDTSFVEVITHLNTKNIITMYPTVNRYTIDEYENQKRKSLTN